MTINYETNTIVITKTEAKLAGKVGSEEFKQMKELRADFPGFKIVVKSAPKRRDNMRDNMKGLTVSYMEKYIRTHDDENGSMMGDFNTLRGRKEDGTKDEDSTSLPYGKLKKWFLEQYPEIKSMDITAIILAARNAA